jgi:hypothetical protein
MMGFRKVTEQEYRDFITTYPLPLKTDYTAICEPPMLSHNDFSGGKVWPESMVAKQFEALYGDPAEYWIKDAQP